MPIIRKIEHKDGQQTAIWEILEDEFTLLEIAGLNEKDKAAFSLLANAGRRLEWLAVRALLKEYYAVCPSISYNELGRPILVGQVENISISHSGKMVAIALHSTKIPGIDIEMQHTRIFKISSRFLSESEKEYLGPTPSVEQLTIVWGAKEVLFKIYEYGGVTFNEELIVSPFELSSSGTLRGSILKDNMIIPVPLEYMQIGDYMMVQTDYTQQRFEKNA